MSGVERANGGRNDRDRRFGRQFRRADPAERRRMIAERHGLPRELADEFGTEQSLLDRSDALVENAVGYLPLPVGIATGFLIDGTAFDIPLATEEPSVIAAASYAAALLARHGGIQTEAAAPVMTAQIYLRNAAPDAEARIARFDREIRGILEPILRGMERRGGGLERISSSWISIDNPGPASAANDSNVEPVFRVLLHIDVRDAMGANVLDAAAEACAPAIERICGGAALMKILSNSGGERLARAWFSIPAASLSRHELSGDEVAERICAACGVALADPERAVTHNKGIMNGVTALATATGNDTRGEEASVHAYAARSGRYRSLSNYRLAGDALTGELELPALFGTVGGATGFLPAARAALRILGNPDGPGLGRIAAAVGLAQNFAALLALVSEGIQAGHMRLHARRVAFEAGARGQEIERVAERMISSHSISTGTAGAALRDIRSQENSKS